MNEQYQTWVNLVLSTVALLGPLSFAATEVVKMIKWKGVRIIKGKVKIRLASGLITAGAATALTVYMGGIPLGAAPLVWFLAWLSAEALHRARNANEAA